MTEQERKEKIEEVLTRGVERLFPNEEFVRERLESGERLTIYLGIDPTGPTLHLGHVIPLRKLRQLQELGHRIILLIGDFTAQIGDPDKSQVRKPLTHEQVLENARRYKEQASLFLNFDGENPAELRYNSEWLNAMNFADVIQLASQMTVQRMLDRDLFRRRIQAGNPVYIHEFLYPLMQGYDSVALDVDGEVGGNDQTFNMLVGRDLLKNENRKEKFVIPMKLLVDNKGNKMGKTTGNMLSLLDGPSEMVKKIMTWPDETLLLSFELLTNENLEEMKKRIETEHPRDMKLFLAEKIVSEIYGEEEAKLACEQWVREVQQKEQPDTIPTISNKGDVLLTLHEGTGESKSALRRLFREGAIRINGERIQEGEERELNSGDTIQIGKKRWYRVE